MLYKSRYKRKPKLKTQVKTQSENTIPEFFFFFLLQPTKNTMSQVLVIEADNEGLLSSDNIETEDEIGAATGGATESDEPPLWVVAKGRNPSDVGIYTTWTEAQQRTTGVSGADHKKCLGMQEAITYMRAAGVGDEMIETQKAKIMTLDSDTGLDQHYHTARPRRHREVKNYRAMSGHSTYRRDKSEQDATENITRNPNNENTLCKTKTTPQDTTTKKQLQEYNTELQNNLANEQKKCANMEKEVERLTELVRQEKQKKTEERHKTETMMQEIKDLKRKYNETKDENKDLKQRTKVLETIIDSTTRKHNTTDTEAKPQSKPQVKTQSPHRITFITDSNRRKITDHLKLQLQDSTITEINTVYTTADLIQHIITGDQQTNPPKTDLTIIMMGTNDARKHKGEEAEANLKAIAENINTDRTLIAEIPPIEIGRRGDEEYEEIRTQRGNINRAIRKHFKRVVKQMETNIAQCNEGTVLKQDGYHLTTKGGQLVGNLIANAAQEAIRGQRTPKTQAENQIEPQAEPQPEPQNKKTQTIIIPPDIGRHVVGKK